MSLSTRPPSGRWNTWCHYGVMAPGLPDPHRFFTVMSIVGTPGVAMFDNDHAIRTSARDTAYVVSATAAMGEPAFRAHSIRQDCEIADDGGLVRFGDDLRIDGRPPRVHVHRAHPDATVDLVLEATGAVTRFVRIPGVYQHWSVLCRCTGTAVHRGTSTPIDGLCTYEYATGVGTGTFLPGPLLRRFKLPARFFTYQVLNVDEDTQLLLTAVRGPAGVPLMTTAHVRHTDGTTENHLPGCGFTVDEHAPEPLVAPDGHAMRMPAAFTWRLPGRRGTTTLELTGRPHGDWRFGLGRGYAGSFAYEGRLGGRPIAGDGYVEYIDVER